MTHADSPWRVAVVGGGIAGLAAAYFLRDAGAVTVFEGSPRLGGKLAVSEVAGIAADEGAEALLARRPEGTDLIRAVGLAGQLVTPGHHVGARSGPAARSAPLPERQFMGVPADLGELARADVLSAAGLARARLDAELPATPQRRRRAGGGGDLGEVRAGGRGPAGGPAARRGVRGPQPRSCRSRRRCPGWPRRPGSTGRWPRPRATLLPAARAGGPPAPVFITLAGGLGTLPPAVAAASGARRADRRMVRELARIPNGWRLAVGPASAPETWRPTRSSWRARPGPASRLLAAVPGAGAAAAALGEISYASMAIVTLAYPRARVRCAAGRQRLPGARRGRARGQGGHVQHRQVAAPARRRAPGRPARRPVLGRPDRRGGDAAARRRRAGRAGGAEFAAATGVSGAPAEARVTRWGGGLPQYSVGHLDRVARIRAAVAGQPAWPCAAPPTTASASRPASPPRGRRPTRCSSTWRTAAGAMTRPRPPMADNEDMTGNDQENTAASEAASKPKARDLNELIRYTMWSVFRVTGPGALDAAGGAGEPRP